MFLKYLKYYIAVTRGRMPVAICYLRDVLNLPDRVIYPM
jgi:hypothetical protein